MLTERLVKFWVTNAAKCEQVRDHRSDESEAIKQEEEEAEEEEVEEEVSELEVNTG